MMSVSVSGLAVSLLLLGASVEIEVGTMRTVSLRTATDLVEYVVTELEARGHTVTVGSPGAAEARTGEGPEERFVFEVVGGVTMLRVVAQRSSIGTEGKATELARVERDLPSEQWQAPLSELLVEIFGEKARAPPESVHTLDERQTRPVSEEKRRPTWPLWISGAGLATLGVGVGFGIKNQSSISRVESEGLYDPQGAMLLDDARTDATLANSLMITGGVVMLGGLILYLVGGS